MSLVYILFKHFPTNTTFSGRIKYRSWGDTLDVNFNSTIINNMSLTVFINFLVLQLSLLRNQG